MRFSCLQVFVILGACMYVCCLWFSENEKRSIFNLKSLYIFIYANWGGGVWVQLLGGLGTRVRVIFVLFCFM